MLHVSDKKCFAYNDYSEMVEHEKEMKGNGFYVTDDHHDMLQYYREYEMEVNKEIKYDIK